MCLTYMAIAYHAGWTVGIGGQTSKVRPHGNCRTFTSFEEADSVAKAMSRGQYDAAPGMYVSNR